MRLEIKEMVDPTPLIAGGRVMITPPLDEDFWIFRVRLTETQAILGFEKFGTVGIGFAQEEDWNTNFPYTCSAPEIYDHIAHNAGDPSITREQAIEAIEMVQAAAHRFKGTQP